MASISGSGIRIGYVEELDRVTGGLLDLRIQGGSTAKLAPTEGKEEVKEKPKDEGKEEKKFPLVTLKAPAKVAPGMPVVLEPSAFRTVGVAKKLLIVKNAHQDDIHAMLQVGADTFVTGSKDGALKMWNTAGKLAREVWNPEKIDYREWITALAPFGATRWISGTRNGYVDLWKNNGEHIKSLNATVEVPHGAKCKPRNLERINCLGETCATDSTSLYYVGRATQFSTHHADKDKAVNTCVTSSNDWVYCITPLTDRKIMVVTGATLDIVTHNPKTNRWTKSALIVEKRSKLIAAHQRPFISGVTALDGKPGVYGIAVFGGSVHMLDLNVQKVVTTYKEHTQRVWQVENIRPQIFASCSDDHTIKIWDARLSESALTIAGNIGRVSTLLRMSDVFLVSGACPDDLRTTSARAQLDIWDIRAL